jgi:hypothetical protein
MLKSLDDGGESRSYQSAPKYLAINVSVAIVGFASIFQAKKRKANIYKTKPIFSSADDPRKTSAMGLLNKKPRAIVGLRKAAARHC